MKSNLFDALNQKQQQEIIEILGGSQHHFTPGEFIFLAGESQPALGLLLSGEASVIKENMLGESMLIDKLSPGQIFGETFVAMQLPAVPVSVVAKSACEVLFLQLDPLTQPDHCESKLLFVASLLKILAQKNETLRKKMSYLTHKTIRGRLEAYFADRMEDTHSREFTIPYNRTELAEYLCMDRSAMSRELSNMKKESILTYQGKTFQYFD